MYKHIVDGRTDSRRYGHSIYRASVAW